MRIRSQLIITIIIACLSADKPGAFLFPADFACVTTRDNSGGRKTGWATMEIVSLK
jgi:hypothetical protein